MNQGSLYPALYRLKRRRLITSSWQVTENNRRARILRVDGEGQAALAEERADWERRWRAVNRVLESSA